MWNGNLLKIRVSEICVKRIRVNQGLGLKHFTWTICQPTLFTCKAKFAGLRMKEKLSLDHLVSFCHSNCSTKVRDNLNIFLSMLGIDVCCNIYSLVEWLNGRFLLDVRKKNDKVVKISRSWNKFVELYLLPKNERMNLFFYPDD